MVNYQAECAPNLALLEQDAVSLDRVTTCAPMAICLKRAIYWSRGENATGFALVFQPKS